METRDGRVTWRERLSGDAAHGSLDLSGSTVWPAFIDSHCHILPLGLDLLRPNLGGLDTRDAVLDAVRDALPDVRPGAWLLAVHYDHNRFADHRHISAAEIDAVSGEVPVLLRHVSGHAGVANSAALSAAGVTRETVDPEGGAFGRDDGGEITGLLLEHALEHVMRHAPQPTVDEAAEAILRAGRRMADLGIACASDMMTGFANLPKELQAYDQAMHAGCPVRMRLFLQWKCVFGPRGLGVDGIKAATSRWIDSKLRVAGVKIFADGAIGSGTAAIYGDYAETGRDGFRVSRGAREATNVRDDRPTSGQLIYSPDKLKDMVATATRTGFKVAVHSIGDYATDLVLDAFEESGAPTTHRIEHAMLLSDAQIERMAALDPVCSMQPEFLVRFAEVYASRLGRERSALINRFASVKNAGIRLTLSSDAPIVSGDPSAGVSLASARPAAFDSAENLAFGEALKAYTLGGAVANGDEDMGGLRPGDWADFRLVRGDKSELFVGDLPA